MASEGNDSLVGPLAKLNAFVERSGEVVFDPLRPYSVCVKFAFRRAFRFATLAAGQDPATAFFIVPALRAVTEDLILFRFLDKTGTPEDPTWSLGTSIWSMCMKGSTIRVGSSAGLDHFNLSCLRWPIRHNGSRPPRTSWPTTGELTAGGGLRQTGRCRQYGSWRRNPIPACSRSSTTSSIVWRQVRCIPRRGRYSDSAGERRRTPVTRLWKRSSARKTSPNTIWRWRRYTAHT